MSRECRCKVCLQMRDKRLKFCPQCGSSEIDDAAPSMHVCAMVYGPPFEVTCRCRLCGHTYRVRGLGSPNVNYCPYCGQQYEETDKKNH